MLTSPRRYRFNALVVSVFFVTTTPCHRAAADEGAATVVVGAATGVPGEEVTLRVSLRNPSGRVTGIQNQIDFDWALSIVACRVNPDIDKNLTSFRIFPDHIRAVVLGLNGGEAIPGGALLYTCLVDIAADAIPGTYALINSDFIGTDADGKRLDISGESGAITVAPLPAGVTPIPTRTPPNTPTPPPIIPAGAVASIEIGSITGAGGSSVPVSVALQRDGHLGLDIYTIIDFGPATSVVRGADGKPDCAVNPDSTTQSAQFVFYPPCVAIGDCTRIVAQLAVSPGPDAARLYTCNVWIHTDIPPGTYPLILEYASAGVPHGASLPVRGTNGAVMVTADFGNTPSANQTPTASPTAIVSIDVGNAVADPGGNATIAVTLSAPSTVVVGVQNDIIFDSDTRILECAVNPQINKSASAFAFVRADGGRCSNDDCARIRALVFAFENIDAIPDDSVLYRCTIYIAATAASGSYTLINAETFASDPAGNSLTATGSNGEVFVAGGPTRTATPTLGGVFVGATPTVGIILGAPPAPATTPITMPGVGAHAGADPSAPLSSDGCALMPVGGNGWFLPLPAFWLLWRQRC